MMATSTPLNISPPQALKSVRTPPGGTPDIDSEVVFSQVTNLCAVGNPDFAEAKLSRLYFPFSQTA